MSGIVTVSQLKTRASGLRELARQFRVRATMFDDDIKAADEFHTRAAEVWSGGRAGTNLGVGRGYVDKVRGMGGASCELAESFDALATDAEEIAERLRPWEAALWGADLKPHEVQQAWQRREELSLDWIEACYGHASLVESHCQPLETASSAELGAFEQPVVDGQTAVLTIGYWARDSVDLWKLGFSASAVALVTGDADYSLADSIRTESETGQSWGLWYPEGGNGYEGGGFITSSTGEEFSIAFPVVVTEDGTYTADSGPTPPGSRSVSNVGGEDEGWHVVEIQTGTQRFFDDANLMETAAATAAGTTGLVRPHPDPAALGYITVPSRGGPPYFTTAPTSMPQVSDLEWAPSSGDPLAYPQPDPIGPNWPDPFPGMRPTPAAPVPTLVHWADLAPLGAMGLISATEINNGTHRVYQVVFEENEDGRRRANVTMYQLGYDEDDDVIIHAQHLWVGEDGELVQQPISYGDPYGSTLDVLPGGIDAPPGQFEGTDYEPGRLPGTTFP